MVEKVGIYFLKMFLAGIIRFIVNSVKEKN